MPSLSNEPKFDFIHFRDVSGKAYSLIFQLGQLFTAIFGCGAKMVHTAVCFLSEAQNAGLTHHKTSCINQKLRTPPRQSYALSPCSLFTAVNC